MSASPAPPETENGLPMTPSDVSSQFGDPLNLSFDVNALLWSSEFDYVQCDGERELVHAFYNGEPVSFPASFWPSQPPTDNLYDLTTYPNMICTHPASLQLANPHLDLASGLPYFQDTTDPQFHIPFPLSLPLSLASTIAPVSDIDNDNARPTPTVVESLGARTSALDSRQKKIYDSLTQSGNIPDDVKHTIIDGLLSDGWAAHERLPVDVCSKLMYVYKADPSASGRGSRVELVHYVCLLCEWTSGVKGRADAWYHMNWHFDIKTKGCDLVHPQTSKPCTWRFHQNNDLWRHQEKVHAVPRPDVKKGGHAAPTPELLLSEQPPLWHSVVASIVKANISSSPSSISPGSTYSSQCSTATRSGPIIRTVPQPAMAAVGSSKTFSFRLPHGQSRRRRRDSETETECEDDNSEWKGARTPPAKRRRLVV